MTANSFSSILRETFYRLGVPAILSIIAVPAFVVISNSPILLGILIATTSISLGYAVITLPRPVIEADLTAPVGRGQNHRSVTASRFRTPIDNTDDRSKRVFDVLTALGIFLMFLPALAIIGLALLMQGRPLLIRQNRIGRDGKLFPCLKFRTVVVNSDAVLQQHLASDAAARAEWLSSQKLKNDPRVTALGRVLRASSLDELPQLINVLRGEMSLVGPRPILPVEAVHYGEDLKFYEAVRPGLTGAWQVSIHDNVKLHASYEDRIASDIDYIGERSFMKDLKIVLMTIPAVLRYRVVISSERVGFRDDRPAGDVILDHRTVGTSIPG